MASGTEKIRALAERMRMLGSAPARNELSRALAVESLQLVENEFKSKNDPYYKPWAPTQQRNPILVKTGALSESFTWQLIPNGFKLISHLPYAAVQQYGTTPGARSSIKTKKTIEPKGITPRKMLPDASTGLPLAWIEVYRKVIDFWARSVLKP